MSKDKKKKGKVAVIIALKPVGGVAPKKPEKTANVGVKKSMRGCPKCGKRVEKGGMCKAGCAG